jgi:hypothetical protein
MFDVKHYIGWTGSRGKQSHAGEPGEKGAPRQLSFCWRD